VPGQVLFFYINFHTYTVGTPNPNPGKPCLENLTQACICAYGVQAGDHLSGKPGNVREFDSCQGNVRDFTKCKGNVREKLLSGKVA